MKNKSLLFAILCTFLIIAMAFTINNITPGGHPWFMYVAFAVLWWPLSVYFGQTKKFKAFSVAGALLISVFVYILNMITSPNFPWFIFPVFVVLWWPISMLFARKAKLYSIISSLYIIAFFVIVNYITSWNVKWFIYPAFAVLWWPMSMFFAKKAKLYSVISTIFITAFLALVNSMASPQYVWFYYPVFALLWWPMSMFLAKKPKTYSIVMSLLTLGFLMLINYMNTPESLWYPYCVFALVWWPLVMILGRRAKSLWFAVIGALSIIAYYVFLYFTLTPGAHPWYLYIILPAIWWPVSIVFGKKALSSAFQLVSLAIFAAYYIVLNIILVPHYFWVINLVYPLLWAAMGIYFGHNKKFFAFSVCAAIVTILYFSILNYMTTPQVIWAVYPSFAILWWPLSMYFFKVKKEKPHEAVN